MSTVQESGESKTAFSPEDFDPEQIVIAFLVKRLSELPKEAMADLAALAPALAGCRDEATFLEIAETMREIVFPELVGQVREGRLGEASSERLTKRAESIGGKIKSRRKELGLTQEQLAQKSELPQSHISRLEAGKHSPSHRTLEKIAAALEIPVGDLDPAED